MQRIIFQITSADCDYYQVVFPVLENLYSDDSSSFKDYLAIFLPEIWK